MASIPGSTATGSENRDEAWVAVKRTIDGATFRSIEVFEAAFEGPNAEAFDSQAAFDAEVLARQREAFYVDYGLSYQAQPTQTLSGHGHLDGEPVTSLAAGARTHDRDVARGGVDGD